MAIRIRVVNGVTVALCAARSVPKEGDVYLDDAHHDALNLKFRRDHAQMDGLLLPFPDAPEHAIIDAEESNNTNRLIWDETYTEVIMPNGKKWVFENEMTFEDDWDVEK